MTTSEMTFWCLSTRSWNTSIVSIVVSTSCLGIFLLIMTLYSFRHFFFSILIQRKDITHNEIHSLIKFQWTWELRFGRYVIVKLKFFCRSRKMKDPNIDKISDRSNTESVTTVMKVKHLADCEQFRPLTVKIRLARKVIINSLIWFCFRDEWQWDVIVLNNQINFSVGTMSCTNYEVLLKSIRWQIFGIESAVVELNTFDHFRNTSCRLKLRLRLV